MADVAVSAAESVSAAGTVTAGGTVTRAGGTVTVADTDSVTGDAATAATQAAVAPEMLDTARQAAEAAARSAGVQMRQLDDIDGLAAVHRLYLDIWRPDPTNPPVTTELLRALTAAGNYVAGAFDGDEMVGACVGFFGAPAEGILHSHIAGVSAAARGRSVGFALKVHQRAWALQRGVSTIAWTYDPLVCRNAHFNLAKLGAVPVGYLPNFYGSMRDDINGADESDRLLVHWELDAPDVAARCAGVHAAVDAAAALACGAVVALGSSESGGPVVRERTGATVLVRVPTDIEAVRKTDPVRAADWRTAVRETLGVLMADGLRVTGFDRTGWYLLTRETR